MTTKSRGETKKITLLWLLLIGSTILVGPAYWTLVEMAYSHWGRIATAQIQRKASESRGGGRSARYEVVVVDYSFEEPGGRLRRDHDEVPSGWKFSSNDTVTVEYIPGFGGFSRLRGKGVNPLAYALLCGIILLFYGVIFGIAYGVSVAQSALDKQKAATPKVAKPISIAVEAKSLTMSRTEKTIWSIVGFVGVVLIVASLCGVFDVYGVIVVPCVLFPLIAIYSSESQRWIARVRTHALHKVSEQLRLEFAPDGIDTLHESLKGFQLATLGHTSVLSNVLHGTRSGTDFAVFDYD